MDAATLFAEPLAVYAAELERHGHTAGHAYDTCRCGWAPKAGRGKRRRSVSLHVTAAEKRASKVYLAAVGAILAAR
jgi:hypothetical protein